MAIFSRKRLQSKETNQAIVYSWWTLSTMDLILIVFLPMSFIYGTGSFLEKEEIIGLKVIPMNGSATIIYWSLWLLTLLHIAFNRSANLTISDDTIAYQSRFVFGVRREMKLSTIVDARIIEKEENIAESPADGRDLASHTLHIDAASGKRIRVKGLSSGDCKLILEKLNKKRGSLL